MNSSLQGKTIVITGGTSGIGQFAAEALASKGARIVQVARDRSRGEAALQRLRAITPNIDHRIHYADLSLIADTKRVAVEIAAQEPAVHVLINNAGALFGHRHVTADGLERTFALNHMAYFAMTAGLLDRLQSTPGARIVNTSSDAHKIGPLDFDDLQGEKAYAKRSLMGGGLVVYGRSKLCNVLFTKELSRRLTGTGVTANCLHPGFVATRFADDSGGPAGAFFKFAKLFALSIEKGSQTLISVASSPEISNLSGEYFVKGVVTKTSHYANDPNAAARLWAVSEDLLKRH